MEAASLTPAQESTLALLRRDGDPVVFDRHLIDSLTADFAEAFEHLSSRVEATGGDLFINKTRLTSVLGCEEHHLNGAPFEWNTRNAVGTVSHRSVELITNWRGEITPADVVDEAIARLIESGTGVGPWLAGLGEADLADLRGPCTDAVVKFLETFPPLDRRWAPVVESSLRWPANGPLTLSGKVDLVIGRAVGSESRKVIIDLKTGGVYPNHLDDLRFYALLETLRTGVPPRKVAGFYLDAGRAVPEDVTIEMLRSAMHRTLEGVGRAVELLEGRPPVRRPQSSCRWCPLRDDCEEGREYLDDLAERYD